MARKRVRRIESLICNTVRDLVFPTSVGLGLVVAGCGGSGGDSGGSGAGPANTAVSGEAGPDRRMDAPLYTILPAPHDADAPTRAASMESRADSLDAPPVFAVLPPREV